MADRVPHYLHNPVHLELDELHYELAMRGVELRGTLYERVATIAGTWYVEERDGTIPLQQPIWMCPTETLYHVRRITMGLLREPSEPTTLARRWTRFYSAFWRLQRIEREIDLDNDDYHRTIQNLELLRRQFFGEFRRIPREYNRLRRWHDRGAQRREDLRMERIQALENRENPFLEPIMPAEEPIIPELVQVEAEEPAEEVPVPQAEPEEEGAVANPPAAVPAVVNQPMIYPAEYRENQYLARRRDEPLVLPEIDSGSDEEPDMRPIVRPNNAPAPPPVQQEEVAANPDDCTICFGAPIDTVYVPCGHMHSCYECANRWLRDDGHCAWCREMAIMVVRVYRT
jgi:hypothetical protein